MLKKFCYIFLLFFFMLQSQSSLATANTKKLVFAGSGGYPPFNYLNEKNEKVGFDLDVSKEIAKRLQREVDYKFVDWNHIIEKLQKKEFDAIVGGMAITEKRKQMVLFTTPYYYSGSQLMVRKNSKIKSLSDLSTSTKIGVVAGTTFEKDAKKLGVQTKTYQKGEQIVPALINKEVDGVITDRIVALNSINNEKNKNKLFLIPTLLRKEQCAIAISKDNSELHDQINKIINQMQKDQTLKKISQKWFQGKDITSQP